MYIQTHNTCIHHNAQYYIILSIYSSTWTIFQYNPQTKITLGNHYKCLISWSYNNHTHNANRSTRELLLVTGQNEVLTQVYLINVLNQEEPVFHILQELSPKLIITNHHQYILQNCCFIAIMFFC